MDLVVGAGRVIVLTEHVTKAGGPKLRRRCTLPLTGARVVDRIITDCADFEVLNDRRLLREFAPGVTVDDLRGITEARFELALDLDRTQGATV